MDCFTANERGACSNRGYYCSDPQPGCICDDTWHGAGFFALNEGLDCTSQDSVTKYLWYITVIFSTVAMILPTKLLLRRALRNNTLWIISYNAKSTYPLSVIVCLSTFNFVAILKVIEPDKLVGKDLTISFAYALCTGTCLLSLINYFFVLIKFLRSLTRSMTAERCLKVRKRFDTLCRLVNYVSPIFFLSSLIPLMGVPLSGI
jgi:hypothetical protein